MVQTRSTAAANTKAVAASASKRTGSKTIPLLITGALVPFAILTLHINSERNGFIPLMTHLRDNGPHYLPASTDTVYGWESHNPKHPSYPTRGDPIVDGFTGVQGIDYVLRVMNCFFAPAFRDLEVGLLSAVFTGGLGVVLSLIMLEAERNWKGWRKVLQL
jgi:hypothetical protein